MADTAYNQPYQIYKFKAAHDANTNLPGVLRGYRGDGTGKEGADQPSSLDVLGGHGQVLLWLNGTRKTTGKNSTDGVFYPGTDISNGDLKCTEAISVDDELLIHYVGVGYREEAV